MITFMEAKEKSKDSSERCVDPQLWHACAGGMVQMPAVNSRVFYFPQGHAEHSSSGGHVDFSSACHVAEKIPPFVLCRVSAVKFLADPDTDEVFARLSLQPENPSSSAGEDSISAGENSPEKPASFAKTLTQSDANNGGGFSVPRYCAETIFPRLDYSADPPVQTILAKDVHGEVWKFRHIYRGTPRRHLLTTGWSTFVNHKKLVAGDSIVFLRADNGDLCVGIRRAKRGGGWGPVTGGRVRPEEVVGAAAAAAAGRAFEAGYYPRGGAPEFCVGAAAVRAAAAAGRWWTGMRFKMAFETEDSSRISWFMGTVNSVRPADPIRWPDSPWRLLHVSWDEPDLLHNVTRVSPWLVEPVPVSPAHFLHHRQLSPPRKKPRPSLTPAALMSPPPESFFRHHEIMMMTTTRPTLTPHPAAGAGMQGARHRYALSMSDLRAHHYSLPTPRGGPTRQLVLFGKPILTEQQMMMVDNAAGAAHCKVFVESEDVGRTLDLSLLRSYDELNAKLTEMFEIEDGSDALTRALYRDSTGAAKHVGDEPFSDFTKTARRLTIPTDSRRHSA